MIFGIDSYFKGINISFISDKQLYKYAEGLENHQLKEKGSLSVQYQLKTSLHISCWDLTHIRGGKEGHLGKGPYAFTHPVLALGRNTVLCAGECLESSDECKKGKTLLSHFAKRKRVVTIKVVSGREVCILLREVGPIPIDASLTAPEFQSARTTLPLQRVSFRQDCLH